MPWQDPIGLHEIAALAHVEPVTVKAWRQRHTDPSRNPFPQPKKVVSGVPLWDLPDVVRWLRATGRITD